MRHILQSVARGFVRAVSGTVQTLRAVAHSRGGHDLGQFLSHGRTELAQVIVNGQPAAMHTPTPHQSQAPRIQPMSQTTAQTVQPAQQPAAPEPNWEAIKAQAVSQMRNIQMPANVAQHGHSLQMHNVRLDPQWVTHSEPITPQPTPSVARQAEPRQARAR